MTALGQFHFVRLAFLLLIFQNSSSGQTAVDPVTLGGVRDNPGSVVVLRPAGLKALSASLGKLIDSELPRTTLKKTDIPLPLVSNGLYSVQQVKMTRYSPARLHALSVNPDGTLNWQSRGFSFTSDGTFAARVFQIFSTEPTTSAGRVTVKATDASVDMILRLNAGKNGQPVITVLNCTAQSSAPVLDMQLAGFFGQVMDFLQKKPQNVGPMVNQIICDSATYYADSVVNEMLRLSPIYSTFLKDPKNTPLQPSGYPNLATGDFVYNYGLKEAGALRDPKSTSPPASPLAYRLDLAGESSWRNEGGTGFNPPPIAVPVAPPSTTPDSAQLEFYLTDFAVNSLLYHAHARKLFDANFSDKNLTLRSHFPATCPKTSSAPCLGDALTELAKKYPGQFLQMNLASQSAPYVVFSSDAKNTLYGSCTVDFSGRNKTGKMETFLSLRIEIQGSLSLNLGQNGVVGGKIVWTKFDSKIDKNRLSGDEKSVLNNGTIFFKALLDKMVNGKLGQGYALSDNHVLVPWSQKMTIKYGQRVAILSSDLNIDQTRLTKLAQQALINVQNA